MRTVQATRLNRAVCRQQADVLFLAQNFQRFGCKFRGNDGFVKQVVDLASSIRVDGPVAANNAAKSRDRVASVRFILRLHQPVIAGQPARIGMLDDRKGSGAETLHRGQRGIQVEQVIV